MIIKDDIIFGLTTEEVEERIKEGKTNKKENRKTKSYREIFLHNILSIFNLIIIIMAILVVPTFQKFGDITNFTFMGTALMNLIIGIVQEIKAKRIVDKLVLTTESKVRTLRNLNEIEVQSSDLVLDDIIILDAGKQIPADSVVEKGELYVNESTITGESDDILKKKGDELYSGSYVVSGEAYCKTIRVGKDNFIEKLSAQATKYSKPKSEIMNSLNTVITSISISLIPISIFLYIIYNKYSVYTSDNIIIFGLSKDLILGLVAAINGMIPYGLFLLTSISLAASVIKLANNKTVVQELYCIEQLARVDTICLDKTGTITDGTMRVDEIIVADATYPPLEIISSMNGSLKGTNMTSVALKDKFGSNVYFETQGILNFNSTNKFSAVTFKGLGTFVLGAPDILIKFKKNDKYGKIINIKASQGNRVLALCRTSSKIQNNTVQGPFDLIALISIHDNIRKGARETLKEFHDNGVDIKIISGDNPITVSAIGKDAGVPHYEKYISLDGLTDEEVMAAAKEYTVFGRVKPNQKKLLVQALKSEGHKVAMTGDGVNDILALRESDCSIAMAAGSEAVKTVAHLVLLDSNFLSLPKVVNEGRRVINNIQRSASLFLSKTFLMMFINIAAIILFFIKPELQFTSPFKEPSQLMIIETFIIGLPTLVLALEPNASKIEGKFLGNIFRRALPGAFIAFISVLVIRFTSESLGIGPIEETNVYLISLTFIFFIILVYISLPYSKMRIWISAITFIVLALCPVITLFTEAKFGADFFHYGLSNGEFVLNTKGYWMIILSIIGTLVYFTPFAIFKIKKQKKLNLEEE